jgi:hypothetical protein
MLISQRFLVPEKSPPFLPEIEHIFGVQKQVVGAMFSEISVFFKEQNRPSIQLVARCALVFLTLFPPNARRTRGRLAGLKDRPSDLGTPRGLLGRVLRSH